MKEETKYICEYCGAAYDTKEEAEHCEATHKLPTQIVNAIYIPYTESKEGYPETLKVQFSDEQQLFYDRR